MLQDGSGLVLFDALWHHVQDVVHHSSTQLQVKVRLHTLFGHSLGYALGVTSWWGDQEQLLLKQCSYYNENLCASNHYVAEIIHVYMQTFKLPGQQISKPPLQQRSDSSHEEEPHSPARGPEATTWTLANRTLINKNNHRKSSQ